MDAIVEKIRLTWFALRDDIKKANWKQRCKITAALVLWVGSVVFGLVAGLEAIELYDLTTTTGFLPSVIENGAVAAVLFYLHTLIPE